MTWPPKESKFAESLRRLFSADGASLWGIKEEEEVAEEEEGKQQEKEEETPSQRVQLGESIEVNGK